MSAATGSPSRALAQEDVEPLSSRQERNAAPTFTIGRFEVTGSTLYFPEIFDEVLKEFTGEDKTAADVEAARSVLERFYQENGYVRCLVNIPEQEVTNGIVRLDVTESRIGRITVNGNRFFTREGILHSLPSLRPGKVLYVPDVESEMNVVNRNPDFKVRLKLDPGREQGIDDVELTVEDQLPLHASVELNNRASHDTSELRLNGIIRYDNLWQRNHSASVQYQTSPERSEEVQVVAGSYVMPAPWEESHYLAGYAVWSDSDTAFGDGFSTTGKGVILGLRYLVPLPPLDNYFHNISLGVDYKDFDETVGFEGSSSDQDESPISYLPFALEYSGTRFDATGSTRLKAGLNWAFRGLVGDQEEFANKRLYARGDYQIFKLELERRQDLPLGMELDLDINGQLATEPLISSEQFSAGGMESVRGYRESDSLGDDGFRASVEWRLSDLGKHAGPDSWLQLTPYLFYDFAWLDVQKAQPGQTDEFHLGGAGIGLRGDIRKVLDYQIDWAQALHDTDRTEAGDVRIHFLVKFHF